MSCFVTATTMPSGGRGGGVLLPALAGSGAARAALAEHVLEAEREGLQIPHHALRGGVEEEVGDHARHGDEETRRRVVHGLGDAVREETLLLVGRGAADGLEDVDERG